MTVYTLGGLLSVLRDEYDVSLDCQRGDMAVLRRVIDWLGQREVRLAAEPLIDMEAPGLSATIDEEWA